MGLVSLGLAGLMGAGLVLALSLRPPQPVFSELPPPGGWFPPLAEAPSVPEGQPPASEEPPASEDVVIPDLPPKARVPGDVPPEGTRSPREVLSSGYVQAGKLTYEWNGRRVAEEAYRLERLPSGELLLLSETSFAVRIALLNVRLAFIQEVRLDEGFGPLLYRLEVRGPLGVGNRRFTVAVEGERALADTGDGRHEVPVPRGPVVFLGTAASYAVLPALHRAWADGDLLRLHVLGERGPGAAPASGAVELAFAGTVEIVSGQQTLWLERYQVRAGAFRGMLLAQDLEFVAFVGDGERPLTVWRSDLFPRGLPAELRGS